MKQLLFVLFSICITLNAQVSHNASIKDIGFIEGITFNYDSSKIFTSSKDKIVVWDVKTKKSTEIFNARKVGRSYINHLQFLPDGHHFLSASYGSIFAYWDIEAKREKKILNTYFGIRDIKAMKIFGDSVYVGGDAGVARYSLPQFAYDQKEKHYRETKKIKRLAKLSTDKRLQQMAVSTDGKNIAIASSRRVKITDGNLDIVKPLFSGSGVYDMDFTPNGKNLVIFCYDGIHIYDTKSFSELRVIQPFKKRVKNPEVQIIDNKHIAVLNHPYSKPQPILIIDINNGKTVSKIDTIKKYKNFQFESFAVSKDAKHLVAYYRVYKNGFIVTATDSGLALFDLKTKKFIDTFKLEK